MLIFTFNFFSYIFLKFKDEKKNYENHCNMKYIQLFFYFKSFYFLINDVYFKFIFVISLFFLDFAIYEMSSLSLSK